MLRERAIEWAQEAREEGLREGKRKGEAVLLLRQLEHRFGELPEEVQRRVQIADAELLLKWGERFVDAAALSEIFTEPS